MVYILMTLHIGNSEIRSCTIACGEGEKVAVEAETRKIRLTGDSLVTMVLQPRREAGESDKDGDSKADAESHETSTSICSDLEGGDSKEAAHQNENLLVGGHDDHINANGISNQLSGLISVSGVGHEKDEDHRARMIETTSRARVSNKDIEKKFDGFNQGFRKKLRKAKDKESVDKEENTSGDRVPAEGPPSTPGAHPVAGPGTERDDKSAIKEVSNGRSMDENMHAKADALVARECVTAELAPAVPPTPGGPLYEGRPIDILRQRILEEEDFQRSRENKRKRKIQQCIMVVCMVVLVAAILGPLLGTGVIGSSSETTDPTAPPTSGDIPATREFLTRIFNGGVEFIEGTPQFRAADWIIREDPMSLSFEDGKIVQRFILAVLYFHSTIPGVKSWIRCNQPLRNETSECGDDELSSGSRWLSEEDECSWFGVTCSNETNDVTELDLHSNNLIGSLPIELSNLSALESLRLSANLLNGTIPPEYARMNKMESLDLGENLLTGSIPVELFGLPLRTLDLRINSITGIVSDMVGQMERLEYLDLQQNSFVGNVPSQIGLLSSNLRILRLSWNALTGTSISTYFGRLMALEELSLDGNLISGTIPLEVFDLTELNTLGLASMGLSGSLSTRVGNLRQLSRLILGRNQMTGRIPTELGLCAELEFFSYRSNSLRGRIPNELVRLTRLSQLSLFGNKGITGTIPSGIFMLTKMRVLQFYDMSLNGPMMNSLIGMWSNLTRFEVHGNSLTGRIESEIGQCSLLISLGVGPNDLSGRIPSEVGKLTFLTSFDARQSKLEGSIPEEFYKLRSLIFLYLKDNQFTSTLSSSIGQLSSLSDFHISGNQFSGTIPASLGQPSALNVIELQQNDFSGSVPQQICDSVEAGNIGSIWADCFPLENPPVACDCCVICCYTDTGLCSSRE